MDFDRLYNTEVWPSIVLLDLHVKRGSAVCLLDQSAHYFYKHYLGCVMD